MKTGTKRRDPIKDPRIDDNFSGNDDHIDALKDLLNEYLQLHDRLSDLIENGDLHFRDVDEYQELCDTLEKLSNRTNPANDPF